MSPKVLDKSLPATALSAHSGFSKGSLGLYVIIIIIGTSVCDNNQHVVMMEQWVNRALLILGYQVPVRLGNYRFLPQK